MQHKIKIPVGNSGQAALNFSLYIQKQINRFSFENIFILLSFLIEIYIKMIIVIQLYKITQKDLCKFYPVYHNSNNNSQS